MGQTQECICLWSALQVRYSCACTLLELTDILSDSLNLSVATALVVQTILLQHPQYASSMEDHDRHALRTSWFPKLAKQRLLTARQKRDRKVLQRDIDRGRATAARQEAGVTLDPKQQASVDRLPSLISKMEEWETALDKEAQTVAAPFVADPPAPFSDLRRADPHRITYVCLLYTSPSPRDLSTSRMPSSA